jgi:hypothetical protein
LNEVPDKEILCPSRLADGRDAAIPPIVKTQLSSNPGNGEAMARKRAAAPKTTKKMMIKKMRKQKA